MPFSIRLRNLNATIIAQKRSIVFSCGKKISLQMLTMVELISGFFANWDLDVELGSGLLSSSFEPTRVSHFEPKLCAGISKLISQLTTCTGLA